MKYDVFISFSVKDREIMEKIRKIVEDKGYSCFDPSRDIKVGSLYHEAIEEALISANFFIVVITKQSKNNQWVMYELESALFLARDRGKIIIPIVDEYENIPIQIRHFIVGKIDDLDEYLNKVFTDTKCYDKLHENSEKIVSLFKVNAIDEAGKLLIEIIKEALEKCKMQPEEKNYFDILVNILIKFGETIVIHMIKEVYFIFNNAVDYIIENSKIFEPNSWLTVEVADELALYADEINIDWGLLSYPHGPDRTNIIAFREQLLANYPEYKLKYFTSNRKEREVDNPDKELYEAAAKYLNESYNMFNLLMNRGAGYEFAKCLLTSYERLKSYCELVKDNKNGALCINKINELKANMKTIETKGKNVDLDNIAENGLKLLLDLKIPNSGKFDVFLCHKREDLDIAENVYDYLRGELKEVFLDSKSLPQLGDSEYRKAIMQSLDNSDHFVVIISKIDFLDTKWVKKEIEFFHSEIDEGRKVGSNFLLLVTENVMKQILETNKKCLPPDLRKYTILLVSEFATKLKDYIK